MKLQLAALILTSAIAFVAAVFAIWPVVADAPWEQDTPCEAALKYKQRLDHAIGLHIRYPEIQAAVVEESQIMEDEIERHCHDGPLRLLG